MRCCGRRLILEESFEETLVNLVMIDRHIQPQRQEIRGSSESDSTIQITLRHQSHRYTYGPDPLLSYIFVLRGRPKFASEKRSVLKFSLTLDQANEQAYQLFISKQHRLAD